MSKPKREAIKLNQPASDDVTPVINGEARRADPATPGKRLNKRSATLLGVLVLAIAGLILAYVLLGRSSEPTSRQPDSSVPRVTEVAGQSTPPAENQSDQSIISQLFGSQASAPAEGGPLESRLLDLARVTMRLLLAALLATLLAFRPHRYLPALQRNPYVAQTQILLAVVAAALMMIVGDNAARAFGIFAAASLVRFRTNIRDPKEITVLLINLAIGLAAGVGRWELAVILSVFVLATLWVLEYFESRQVVRSMQLKVRTRNVSETERTLQTVFGRHKLSTELRGVDREDESDHIGRIVYYVTVGPRISTDELSEEIFSADPLNIDTVEWHQKKSGSYAYR